MPAKTRKPAKKSASALTEDERAAMRDLVRERRRAGKADGASDVRAAIAAMAPPDRAMAERIDAIVRATAPGLAPRTWYGMPAYAKDGDVLCFFQAAAKFKTRYATLGFTDKARLDEGRMWPNYYAIQELGPAEEERIRALLKRAVG